MVLFPLKNHVRLDIFLKSTRCVTIQDNLKGREEKKKVLKDTTVRVKTPREPSSAERSTHYGFGKLNKSG